MQEYKFIDFFFFSSVLLWSVCFLSLSLLQVYHCLGSSHAVAPSRARHYSHRIDRPSSSALLERGDEHDVSFTLTSSASWWVTFRFQMLRKRKWFRVRWVNCCPQHKDKRVCYSTDWIMKPPEKKGTSDQDEKQRGLHILFLVNSVAAFCLGHALWVHRRSKVTKWRE